MPRLVTGVFYTRSEAERALQALRSEGIPLENLYLETEIEPSSEVGRKGGEVSSLEEERRFAGLETGLLIGVIVGCLAGLGIGTLAGALQEMIQSVSAEPVGKLPSALVNPFLASIVGAVIGLIAGGIIGWVIDFTLSRLGAGPPLPAQETLVTVRTDESQVDNVCGALFRNRARHLHVAEATPV
jgi:hypothetical protein